MPSLYYNSSNDVVASFGEIRCCCYFGGMLLLRRILNAGKKESDNESDDNDNDNDWSYLADKRGELPG